MKKRPEAVARLWWILQKICFITFKSFIPKQFFFIKEKKIWINPWPQYGLLKPFIHLGHPVYKYCILLVRDFFGNIFLIFTARNFAKFKNKVYLWIKCENKSFLGQLKGAILLGSKNGNGVTLKSGIFFKEITSFYERENQKKYLSHV